MQRLFWRESCFGGIGSLIGLNQTLVVIEPKPVYCSAVIYLGMKNKDFLKQ